MRVLFADNLPPSCVEGARAVGYECEVQADLDGDSLPGAIAGYDALVVRSTTVSAHAIAASDALGLIVRAGAGTNTIDVAAAADAAIQVSNVPGQNAIAVAELTMGLLLAIDRRIADGVIDSRAGKWDKKTYATGRGLYGRTIGIVGLGAIGMAVAERAHAFGMKVLVVAKTGRTATVVDRLDAIGAERITSLSVLVGRCDVVSLHVPAAPETQRMLNSEFLSNIKPGTILLNTSRGDTIDEDALLDAIETRSLWVGLDVYPTEPSSGRAEFHSALASHPRVYGTHHIGASTEQAQEAVGDAVVGILERFASGSEVPNVVNLAPMGTAPSTMVVRHRNRVGVLRDVLNVVRGAGLNVEDMANRIFSGGEAAMATIQIAGELPLDVLEQVRAVTNVLSVSVSV